MFAVPCESASTNNADRSKSIALLSKYKKLSEVSVFSQYDIKNITELAKNMKNQKWITSADNAWLASHNIAV